MEFVRLPMGVNADGTFSLSRPWNQFNHSSNIVYKARRNEPINMMFFVCIPQ